MEQREAGCNCGRVRLAVAGPPKRVGLCHCRTCRRETGGPFMWFGVWDRARVTVQGATRSWVATTDHRHFCPDCGSSLFAVRDNDAEIELRLGALDDAPSNLAPGYEAWVPRREHWLHALPGAPQHERNRPG